MKFLKNLLPYIIIVIVVILIRSYIMTPIKVNGASMAPTLTGGEIMILNKLDSIKRYDIVVVNLEKEEDLIKRVVAMPGETIEIKNNIIYINDKKIKDKFGFGLTYDIPKIVLASDEYFVLGDNRTISLDSRVFGPIKVNDIEGTTNLIVYPFKSFGKVK